MSAFLDDPIFQALQCKLQVLHLPFYEPQYLGRTGGRRHSVMIHAMVEALECKFIFIPALFSHITKIVHVLLPNAENNILERYCSHLKQSIALFVDFLQNILKSVYCA